MQTSAFANKYLFANKLVDIMSIINYYMPCHIVLHAAIQCYTAPSQPYVNKYS